MVVWRVVWVVALGLLIPALLLTTLRIVQPAEPWAVRLVSFAPWAVPLYLLVLVIAVPAIWRARDAHRVTWGAVLLLVVGALGAHVGWLVPQFTGSRPAADTGTTPLRILMLNTEYGGADGDRIVRLAREHDVDLIALLEATPALVTELDRAGIDDEWPHRLGEPEDGTPAGSVVFSAAALSDEDRLETGFRSIGGTLYTDGRPLRLYLVHPAPPVGDTEAWRTELETVADGVEGADIVMGDFNATPDHAPLRDMLDSDWRSAAEITNAGWLPTWPMNGRYEVLTGLALPPSVQIDHVLVGDGMTALELTRIVVPGTDHAGLVAEVAPAR